MFSALMLFASLLRAQSTLDKSGNKIVVEPSPTKAVVKKVIGSAVCAYIFMNWITVYPIKRLSGKCLLNANTRTTHTLPKP